VTRFRRFLEALFRGSDSGQSIVEYLILVGACALVGIAGFTGYGKSLKRDLSADAKHIEGEGLPNTEGILGSLGADYNELPGWCVKPNYCFAAGTPVEAEHGDRAIESIVVGDRVWARDVTTGAIALRSVVNTYRTARVPVVDLELSINRLASEHISVTRSHLFWVEGPGWVRADALGAQTLWATSGATAARLHEELLDDASVTTVYNLEVSEFHSYFVGHSHVLVHNGNPTGDGCPTGSADEGGGRVRKGTEAGYIDCGETGTYYYDLGGWDKDAGGVSRYPKGRKKLVRDHIPSGEALKVRAAKLMDDLAKWLTDNRCRELTDDEQKELADAKSKAVAGLETEAYYSGFAIVEPVDLHTAGRTNGSKNKPLYENDSRDLPLAAEKDARALEKLIAAGKVADPECAAQILAGLKHIRERTQDDYDAELGAIAEAQLESSGFNKIVTDTCDGHDLQTESQRH
jgi:hypothetical protein